MKKLKEWVKYLPKEYRADFIENIENGTWANLNSEYSSLEQAIENAFEWCNTPQEAIWSELWEISIEKGNDAFINASEEIEYEIY